MHLLRAGSLTGFQLLMNDLGLDSKALMRHAGLAIKFLNPKYANEYIPLKKFERLLALAEEQSQRYDLAIKLGSLQKISVFLGVLGFVIEQADTVGEALAELQHFFSFQAQGSFLQLEVVGEYAGLSYVTQNAASLPTIRYTSEFAAGAGVSMMKTFCGEQWKPELIHFIHAAPIEHNNFSYYVEAPVRFNQEQTTIVFKTRDLMQPLSSANAELKTIRQVYLKQLEQKFVNDPKSQIEQLIQQGLSSGTCSADKVAEFMGVHRRTLYRILKRSNTTYSDLLDKVRQDIALKMLKQSNLSITAISNMLCYSELSAFSRAFKKWFGQAPQDYKSRMLEK